MKNLISIILLSIVFSCASYSQIYIQSQKITAPDRESSAAFATSISVSEPYAIIGAPNESKDSTGNNPLQSAGAAYIFERDTTGNWHPLQKLVASDRLAYDLFGCDVAISGNTAVIGAYDKPADTATYPHSGAIYIYERDTTGNVWNEIKKIVPADTGAYDHFGYRVAISGNYIIVGSPIDSEDSTGNNTLTSSGSAYMIEKDSTGNWQQVQKITATDRSTADIFGAAVGISGDYAIVGAYQEDEDATGSNTLSSAGSAYIFKRDTAGYWHQTQKITASDRDAGDRYGIAVAIDSIYAIAGAYLEDEDEFGFNQINAAGSAYIYKHNNNQWNEVKKITAPDRDANDYFGITVTINNNTAIAGAQNETADAQGYNPFTSAGAAYIFQCDNNGNWNYLNKITASDRAANDYFGTALAVQNNQLFAGAKFEDEDTNGSNTLSGSGSLYVFEYSYTTQLNTNEINTNNLIFPNPVTSELSILSSYRNEKLSSIELINLTGQCVYKSTNITDTHSKTIIPTNNFENGLYLLRLHYNKSYYNYKLIIAKP